MILIFVVQLPGDEMLGVRRSIADHYLHGKGCGIAGDGMLRFIIILTGSSTVYLMLMIKKNLYFEDFFYKKLNDPLKAKQILDLRGHKTQPIAEKCVWLILLD